MIGKLFYQIYRCVDGGTVFINYYKKPNGVPNIKLILMVISLR